MTSEQKLAACCKAAAWREYKPDDYLDRYLENEVTKILRCPLSSHDDVFVLQKALVKKMGDRYAVDFYKFVQRQTPHKNVLAHTIYAITLQPSGRIEALYGALPEALKNAK